LEETTQTPTKGEAQPKHWEPKRKNDPKTKKSASDEGSEDDDLNQELRESSGLVSLVRNTEETPQDQDETPTPEPIAKERKGPILSKKERQAQKKKRLQEKQKQAAAEEASSSGEDDESTGSNEDSAEDTPTQPKVKGPVPVKLPRGKKSKLKKAEKYSWMDDEDRRQYMELIGHKVSVQDGIIQVEPGKGKKAQQAELKIQEVEQKQELKVERENKRIRREKEDEELLKLMREENIELLSEEDRKKIEEMKLQGLGVNLASLTGKPVENDILIFAIPVCAPYEVLKDYKFKIKVLPGGGKKGSATKTAIHHFLTNCNATPAEKDLIKAIPEEEVQFCMIGQPKLSGPGVR